MTRPAKVPSPTYLLSMQCLEDSQRWFGDQASATTMPHLSLALAGEVGEFCNIVKKIDRGSLDPNEATVRFNLAEELTDVYIYLLCLAGVMHIDLERSYEMVRAKNQLRFSRERTIREAKNA